MGNFQQLILPWLLVLVFIIHDGEEVLFLPQWVQNNISLLDAVEKHFPTIRRPLQLLRENNRRQFAFSVLFLFCFITIFTGIVVFQPDNFAFKCFYVGITGVFTLHLGFHVLQSVILQRIVPGTITSTLVFLPSLYLWQNQVHEAHLTFVQSFLVLFASMVIFLPVFVFALRFGHRIGKPTSNRSQS